MLSRLLSSSKALTRVLRPIRSFSEVTNVTEYHSMHKKYIQIYDLQPSVGHYCYIAPSSTIAGDVYMGDNISIDDNVVIRGDINVIRILGTVHIGIVKNNFL